MESSSFHKIRIVVSENQKFPRHAFVRILQKDFSDIQVVGETGNPEEAGELVARLKPDVLLFDLRYDGWDQEIIWAHVREMKKRSPNTHILGYTGFFGEEEEPARKAGCDMVLDKNAVDYTEVHTAIITLANRPPEHRVTPAEVGLTDTEMKSLKALALKSDNKSAAESLYISPHTQKGYIQKIKAKLGSYTGENIRKETQVITVALRLGLIDLEDLGPKPISDR